MPIDITNKNEKKIALTGAEIEETLLQAHLSKDAIAKINGLEASASEIDGKCTKAANSIVIDGDSITRYNGYTTDFASGNVSSIIDSKGYFAIGNAMLGNRFNLIANNGVGGNTSVQILERIDESISLGSKYIFILAGTNDISLSNAYSAESVKTNLLAIYNKIIRSGKIVIAATIPPLGTYDATISAKTIEINRWLRDLETTLDNFILVDFYKALIDTSTNTARTDLLLSDATHPTTTGATAMGYEIYNKLKNIIPTRYFFDGTSTAETIITNPYFNGDTSGKASNWTFSGGSTFSKVSRDYGLYWQQIATTSSSAIAVSQDCTSGFSVGDIIKVYAEIEFDSSCASVNNFKILINFLNSSNAQISSTRAPYTDGSYANIGKEVIGKQLILETHKITIPATTAKIQVYVQSNLYGTIRIGKIVSRKF